MNKKELEQINRLCKKAHAKGAATQFMLRGLKNDEAVYSTAKTAAVVENLYKVAAYRKEILKAAFREHLASR